MVRSFNGFPISATDERPSRFPLTRPLGLRPFLRSFCFANLRSVGPIVRAGQPWLIAQSLCRPAFHAQFDCDRLQQTEHLRVLLLAEHVDLQVQLGALFAEAQTHFSHVAY